MDEAEEVFEMALVADHQTPEVLQPCAAPRHLPASPLAAQWAAVLGEMMAVGAMRRDEFNACFAQRVIESIAVVGHVADASHRRLNYESLLKGGRRQGRLVGRSTGHVRGARKTLGIRDRHELAPLAALGFADSRAPFFAGAKLPSMQRSSSLIPPRSYSSWANASNTPRNPPERTHC